MSRSFAVGGRSFDVGGRSFTLGDTSSGGQTTIETFDYDSTSALFNAYNSRQGEQSLWDITNSEAAEGSALTVTGTTAFDTIYSMPGGELPHYFSQDDSWEFYFYSPVGTGDSTSVYIRHSWGHQDGENFYRIALRPNDDIADFQIVSDGNEETIFQETGVGFPSSGGNWYFVEIYWSGEDSSGNAGEHFFNVRQVDQFNVDGYQSEYTHLSSFNALDTTYTSGGIGWGFAGDTADVYWDSLRTI